MFIPEGSVVRKVVIYHDEDGTYLRAIQFFDKSESLLLQSGHVRGTPKTINLAEGERLIGFKSVLSPNEGGECAHFNF